MFSINNYNNENNSLVKCKFNTTFYYNDPYVLVPDLVNIQRNSFQNFVVSGLFQALKKKKSLIFRKSNHKLEIIFFPECIQFKKPEINSKKALHLGKTYGSSIYIPVLVKFSGWKKNRLEWILLGFLPLITKQGHFVINGIPRVVLHQMIRNPGVYILSKDSRTRLPTIRIVPEQGSWVNITLDKKNRIWITTRILRRKISVLIFLQALGLSLSEIYNNLGYSEILEFSLVKDLKTDEKTRHDRILIRANLKGHPFTQKEAQRYLYAHFLEYTSQTREQVVTDETAKEFFWKNVWNLKNRNIGYLGRKQFSEKLGSTLSFEETQLTADDISLATKASLKLLFNEQLTDDIDSLSNKRIRGCGEFLYDELNRGLQEFELVLTRKFSNISTNDCATFWRFNRSLLSKCISKTWKSFFTGGTLSQFMDETNPLAETTHKRRITVLGTGGVSSKQTTIQIRGIHPTYYGRLCPIETPEGQNAGLVNSFTVYTQRNSQGTLETPFFEVYKGQVQKELKACFVSPQKESSLVLAPADICVSKWNQLPKTDLPVRKNGKFEYALWNQITKQSIGLLQMISVATSLIPFLEHDDANRALMGSNMQRQAVPLLRPESALVSTGLETRVICDVNHGIRGSKTGYVTGVSSTKIQLYKGKNYSLPLSNVKKLFKKLSLTSPNTVLLATDVPNANALAISIPNAVASATVVPGVSAPFQPNTSVEKSNNLNTVLLLPPKDSVENSSVGECVVLDSKNEETTAFYETRAFLQSKNTYAPKTKNAQNQKFINIVNNFNKITRFKIYKPVNQKQKQEKFFFTHLSFLPKTKKFNYFLNYQKFFQSNQLLKITPNKNLKNITLDLSQAKKQKSSKEKEYSYFLDTYQRTNQSTCITQRPNLKEGEWIQITDVIADGAASSGGKLALGKNVLIAYVPWEGYNFEDAILISDKLVQKDLFTSLHIDYYEIEVKNTQYGLETITNKIPLEIDASSKDKLRLQSLNSNGLIQIGTWVQEGDYLVGKISPLSPKGPSVQQQYEKLYNVIMQRDTTTFKNTSLRVPKGVEGFVLDVQILPPKEADVLPLAPKNTILRVRVALLQKRNIQVGDKMAGRHGNKGVISKILPCQDMPYLPDGNSIDIVLNPLGVPSRMNVGQILESLLGLAGKYLHESYKIELFDEKFGAEASRSLVYSKLYEASVKTASPWLFEPQHPGKIKVFDGRTGESFDQPVTVGYAYMLKLIHLVDDKIHARATGPYSAVTQQPVRGRARNGGQRLGEMEVWALQAYGAAYTLQELLTIKSDDIDGRKEAVFRIYTNRSLKFGQPESFKVLLRELQSLCFNLQIYKYDKKTKTINQENLNTLESL
jgi:DNA-directed RNA polymerase beta subunit